MALLRAKASEVIGYAVARHCSRVYRKRAEQQGLHVLVATLDRARAEHVGYLGNYTAAMINGFVYLFNAAAKCGSCQQVKQAVR